jgi:trigger factor
MKHTLKKLSDTKINISVTLDEAELKIAKQRALKHLASHAKVPGFRTGKVPANVAEKNLDPMAVANETTEAAINIALNDIVVRENIRVLDRPQIDIKDFKPYESMVFEAEMEILPEIKLGDYKELKAKKDSTKVTETEIDQVIDQMRERFAEKKEVTRAAKSGDEAIVNFEGRDAKGELVEGAKGDDYPLVLGSSTFIPGFEEGIIGHKAGDEFDLKLTFPKDYHTDALKGAKVIFKTTIKKLNEIVLPEVNDEFAAKVGPFKSVAEMREDAERELAAQKENAATEKLKDDLVGALVEVSTIPVPQLLVDDQMKSIEQDTMQNLMYRGITPEDYMKSQGYKDHDEWHEKEFKVAAERRVKAGLALAELSKIEQIQVTQSELEQRHNAMLDQYKNNVDVQKQLNTPEARRDLANRLLTEKTVDRLIELNSK